MKIIKIVGPPGTGKTTFISQLLQQATERYPLDQIGGVSFTNASVNALVTKIKEVVVVPPSTKMMIKTIHAHCFDLLGLSVDHVANKKLKEFNAEYPDYALYTTTIVEDEDDKNYEYQQNQENYRLFRDMQIFRNKRIDKASWPTDVHSFWKCWSAWMQKNDYYDFTSMLEWVLDMDRCIPVSILFVDECQDLTRLQIDIVLNWARSIEKTYFVGDSDQAIYRFAGGQPEVFRDIKYDERIVLSQSYRVPPVIHDYACKILSQIGDREPVEYHPFVSGGPGKITQCLEPDFSLPGSHILICRCQFRVYYWIQKLEETGLLWCNPYRPEDLAWNPQLTEEWKAIEAYKKFMAEGELPGRVFKKMLKVVRQVGNMARGTKKKIEDMGFSADDVVTITDIAKWDFSAAFIDEARHITEIFNLKTKSGQIAEKWLAGDRKPPVIVGTIHSVKGGEADHVWIDMTMTKKIRQAMTESETARFDELRIKYVAVTRARKTVGFLR